MIMKNQMKDTQGSSRMIGCVPHTDQDVSIPEDEEQDVVLCDVVEVCIFLIGKEKVRFPQTLEHFRVNGQRFTLKVGRKP